MLAGLSQIQRDSVMGDLEGFRAQLDGLLVHQRQEEEKNRTALEVEMRDQIASQEDLDLISSNIFFDIIEPRLKVLADLFEDAEYCKDDRGYFGRVTFNTAHHFRGVFALEVGLFAEVRSNEFFVKYQLGVVPVFITFAKGDTHSYPLRRVSEEEVTLFVERAIENAIVTYSKYTHNENYFVLEFNHKDPVCGMMVNEFANPETTAAGKTTHYFCSSSCRKKFLENPSQYSDSSTE